MVLVAERCRDVHPAAEGFDGAAAVEYLRERLRVGPLVGDRQIEQPRLQDQAVGRDGLFGERGGAAVSKSPSPMRGALPSRQL